MPEDDDERVTSALLASSVSWDQGAVRRQPTRHPRKRFSEEAMSWQQVSQHGSWAEIRARINQTKRRRSVPESNRLVEIHGLMGAIGEQVALCWTIEQDAQRLIQTRRGRLEEHQRLVLRATCESAAHFLLGAAHSLGNLVLRATLLNDVGATEVKQRHPKAKGFRPGADERSAWLTLHEVVKTLRGVKSRINNKHLQRCIQAVSILRVDPRFETLDRRRGMDYHRRRPQSVPHASPTRGTVRRDGGTITISMAAAVVDPEADANRLHEHLVQAMKVILETMRVIRLELPKAIRAEQIIYHEDYRPRPRHR